MALTSCNDWLTEDTPGVTKRGDYITSAETATEVVNAAIEDFANVIKQFNELSDNS